jgi:hypothetical protein
VTFRRDGPCCTFAAITTPGSVDGPQSAGHVGKLLGEAIARAIVAASTRTCPAEGRTGIAHLLEERGEIGEWDFEVSNILRNKWAGRYGEKRKILVRTLHKP